MSAHGGKADVPVMSVDVRVGPQADLPAPHDNAPEVAFSTIKAPRRTTKMLAEGLGLDRQRRDFITLLGGAAAVLPLTAWAQQTAGRVYRVGYFVITSRERSLHLMKAFEEGLPSLGYRVVEHVRLPDRLP